MLLAFEPVTSLAYDLAKEEYQKGVFELRLIRFHDKDNYRANFYCSKSHLMSCVVLLDNLYHIGQVECIKELPSPETIRDSNRTQLKSLSDTLKELYFPELIN